MSSPMDELPYRYLMIFCLFASIYGGGADVFPSCEVELKVRRGTTLRSAPLRSLTVRCPVRHCGSSVNVTWCKLHGTHRCEPINARENVEIKQNDNSAEDELTSVDLTFKRISTHDDGLYKCVSKGNKPLVSHTVNISVSDAHQGVETTDNTDHSAAVSLSAAAVHDEGVSWLPYLHICGGIALLVVALTVLTLLTFQGKKKIQTYKPTKGQEISTHMIPDLPKWRPPSTPVLRAHFILNDIYSLNTAPPPPSSSSSSSSSSSPPFLITGGNRPLADAVGESQASDHAAYAVINHTKSGRPAGKQPPATPQDKRSEYAAVSVS